MDPQITAELARTDPAIAFRASTGHLHHNWARIFYCRPELYLQPQSIAEVQKIVKLAVRCRRRIVVVGAGHSPSELTCTSSWLVSLAALDQALECQTDAMRMVVQAGMSLRALNARAAERGLTLPVLGSIDEQSVAGAIATATHGSSLAHGPLGAYVRSLRLVLGNGAVVRCSREHNTDLFRAALVSLGALGVIVECEVQLVRDRNIAWVQTVVGFDELLAAWERDLWTQAEHTRVWWLPYSRRAILWRAQATDEPVRRHGGSWYDGAAGYYVYKALLWAGHYVPQLLPAVEWFVFGMQYGFDNSMRLTGVEPQREGLLMNCLYSQYVNEWAIPLADGPQALRQLDEWVQQRHAYVHAPVEVRVVNSTQSKPHAFLDTACRDQPTLYLNATLYRPAGLDPPCRQPYYEYFEQVMTSFQGRPHWAKNFTSAGVTYEMLQRAYGADLSAWQRVRREADPEGVFLGAWHRRTVLGSQQDMLEAGERCEEMCVGTRKRSDGGTEWLGAQVVDEKGMVGSIGGSEESFDVFAKAEAEEEEEE